MSRYFKPILVIFIIKSQVDLRARMWICPFCLSRNQFPPHYRDLSPVNLPPELLGPNTSVEYILSKPPSLPPIFLFVVDTCLDEADLSALKNSLVVALTILPQDALIGIITFGTMVQVHELGANEFPKSYVFRGSKEYSSKQVQDMLGLGITRQNSHPNISGAPLPMGASRFLQPISQCEFQITSIIEQIQCDPWPVASESRSTRCTGVAAGVAIGLLEVILFYKKATFQNTGAYYLIFIYEQENSNVFRRFFI